MASQLSNHFSDYFLKPTPEEDREAFVIDFVKRHAGCSKRAVYTSKENTEYGAKATVERIIDNLKKKGVIKVVPDDNKNSKKVKLFLVDENPLSIVPNQLSVLEKLLVKFAADLVNIYSQYHSKWPNQKHFEIPGHAVLIEKMPTASGYPIWKFYYRGSSPMNPLYVPTLIYETLTLVNIIQIPFAILDVIFAPFKYFQVTKWIDYDDTVYNELRSSIFSKFDKFSLIAFNIVKSIYRQPYKYNTKYENDEYFIAAENNYQRLDILEKICILRHICKSIGMLQQLETMLNYLIENNMEYFTLRNPKISPHYRWPNDKIPDKTILDIIHDDDCPINTKDREINCKRLEEDPSIKLTL
jgi:hypothetical protein